MHKSILTVLPYPLVERRVVWRATGTLVALLLAASPLAAQLPPTPREEGQHVQDGPRLFVAQRAIEVGKVIDGEKVPLVWRLENHGNADLVIERTQAACGCTIVQLKDDEKIIRPGGTLELKADFDSTRRQGEQVKSVSVISNDPLEPELKLSFRAEVEVLFETDPNTELVNLRSVQRGQPAGQTYDVRPAGGRTAAEIVSVQFGGAFPITAKIEPLPVGGVMGQRIRFHVAEDAALGAIAATATVRIRVDGVERDRNLMVRGEVVGDLTWTPKMVGDTRLPSLRGKKFAPVNVASPNKQPFDIISATIGGPLSVAVEEKERAGGRFEYNVVVSVRDDAPPGPVGSMLEIRTNSLDQPVIRVPVFAIVADLVEIDPPFVLLRQDGTPVGRQRRVKLQAATNQALETGEIRCDLPGVTASVDEEASARYHHLRYLNVRLEGNLPKGRHESVLHIATGVPGAEQLAVPVLVDVP